MSTRVPLIFGCMTFGEEGKVSVRTSALPECQKILDVYFKHGGKELDAARNYAGGTTEEYLSKLDLHGATVDTKLYPNTPGDHSAEKLASNIQLSIKALGKVKIRVLYLHAPDRSIPFEETCAALDKLHKQGLFEIFGLSNFASWEVAKISEICITKGYLQPKIYQAMYNALQRSIEPELIPCLRNYGIRLVVYNPLAGGLFSGKITSVDKVPTEGRFAENGGSFSKMYRERYVRQGYLDALQDVKAVADKHGLRLTEVALRWCQHHSLLSPSDGVILGASSAQQLEDNCTDSAKGPLPEDVLEALNLGWAKIGGSAPLYWR